MLQPGTCSATRSFSSTCVGPPGERATHWYQWIHRRVAENVPYDKLVEGIVLAVSRKPEQSVEEYYAEMSSYFRKDNPGDFSARDTMPHFWTRKALGRPDGKALAFAWSFLGVSLQRAQCHKHPYDQWTKQDFDAFTAFFKDVTYNTRNDERDEFREMQEKYVEKGATGAQQRNGIAAAVREGKTIPWKEVFVNVSNSQPRRRGNDNRSSGRVITPKLLGGEEVYRGERFAG